MWFHVTPSIFQVAPNDGTYYWTRLKVTRRVSKICCIRVARPTIFFWKNPIRNVGKIVGFCFSYNQHLIDPHFSLKVVFLTHIEFRSRAPLLSFKYQSFATPWSRSSRAPKFGSIFKNLMNARAHFTWLLENQRWRQWFLLNCRMDLSGFAES